MAVMPGGAGNYSMVLPAYSNEAGNQGGKLSSQVPCLTAGLPTPDAISTQKEVHARTLEEQLRQGVEVLGATHKQKTDYLHATANQQKHAYHLMLDQQVKHE